MAKIHSTGGQVHGCVCGVHFLNGVGETENKAEIKKLKALGYRVEGDEGEPDGDIVPPGAAPTDPPQKEG